MMFNNLTRRLLSLKKEWHFIIWVHAFLVILFLAPGPIYQVITVCVFFFWIFILYRNISLAALATLLLVLFVDRPIFNVGSIAVQEYFYNEQVKFLSNTIEIPFRFVVFIIFIPLFFRDSIRLINRKIERNTNTIFPLILFVVALVCLLLSQLVGGYKLKFSWQFYVLVETFMIVPVLLPQIIHSSQKKMSINIYTFFAIFVMAWLILLSLLAVLQQLTRNVGTLQIEFPNVNVSTLYAIEGKLFRSFGTFSHPNYFGMNIAMLLITLLTYYIYTDNRNMKQFSKIALVLGSIALILSYSRWAWVSFCGGLFILLKFSGRRLIDKIETHKIHQKILRIFVLGLFVVLAMVVIDRFSLINTYQGRKEAVNVAFDQIFINPVFGLGPGNSSYFVGSYRRSYEGYVGSLKGVHNTILLYIVENGIFPVLCLLSFVFYMMYLQIKMIHIRNGDWISLSALSVTVTFLIGSLAYPLYVYDPSINYLLILNAVFLSTFASKNFQ